MTDLILLHPPSIYDFRQETILYGPSSDLIPSSNVYELYPIGFASIAEYLKRAGYRVRIVNLAARMLTNPNFSAEKMIQRLRAPIFGIDLHWLVHCHGAIEIAKLVKKYHPEAKVVMGGLSASYYHQQLLEHPEIDYVLRGDSTEEPFRQLMDCIIEKGEPDEIPNLVWRNNQGTTRINPFSHVPSDFSNIMINYYDNMVRSAIRYHDLASYLPFKDWLHYPITAVLTCRGCTQNCVVCGGSASAFKHFYHREKPAFRSPHSVARDIKQIGHFSSGPIFILGDLCQPENGYAYETLRLLQEDRVKNQLIFELFSPVPRDLLDQMSLSCPNFCLEITPETHDPEIRQAAGKHYSNQDLEQTMSDALSAGCGRLDIFFMIGLPKQTPQSVMDTIDYCDYLLEKFRGDKRLSLFIAPLSPFLDPGSLGFEQPEHYGYRVLFRTLNEHRQALVAPSWKYSLNYETEWMTRQQIVDTAYKAILHLNRLKAKHGVISPPLAELTKKRIQAASEMMHRIDGILASNNLEDLPRLKAEIDKINMLPISDKIQLELPVGLIKIKPWCYLWSWITRR
ncbi:TIGR04190 family B12-binding domain/radical SAM domain protein [Chloroflexota bacterium]